ncbi:MAG: DNA (cytosine-5-)-methyltransferase [Vampirovibrio sp.]|nr:DNA (cytosine-5-)-methyltransferase [Vampirovibrio sp.]
MLIINDIVNDSVLADILSISKTNLKQWIKNKKIIPLFCQEGTAFFSLQALKNFEPVSALLNSNWSIQTQIKPNRGYSSIELFAGAGGMALGMEKAGLDACILNEVDKAACKTLRKNRPHWNISEQDIREVDFNAYEGVDFVAGGFPCQAFSYSGKKLGFEDVRGTLFFEFARVIKETQPKVLLGENVRGLLTHDNGNTLSSIKSIIAELGYTLIEPKVLKAIFYGVPQKRERLFLVGIRNDLLPYASYEWPSCYSKILTIKDVLKAGELYSEDVPKSIGQVYPKRKAEIMQLVPEGGYWKDLSDELQQEYMRGSYHLGGGKTGLARRLSWNEPSLTLTCAPAQKQTERCHPTETRPLTVREYARIQTFPDEWIFEGSLTDQYKQIGNAVPVNLAYAMGLSIVKLLNTIENNKSLQRIIKTGETEAIQLSLGVV